MSTEHRPAESRGLDEPSYSFFGPGLAAIGIISLAMLISQFAAGTCPVIPTTEELAEFEPYRRMAAESFRAGTFPLWSPEFISGLPLAGWPHSSAFYPFALFFGPLDYSHALTLSLCLHVFIFSAGLLYFLRAMGFRAAAASLPAAVLGLGAGLWFMSLNFLPTILTTAWAPWLWGFAFRLESSRRTRHFAGVAAAFALQILGGRYDFIIRELISLAVFAILMRRRLHLSTVGLWLLAGIMGAAAAGMALIPHFEYMGQSLRQLDLGFDYYKMTQAGPLGIGSFLGQSLSPALLAALAAIAWKKNRGMVKPALVLLAFIILWVGPPDLWLRLNYYLPILGKARYGNVSMYIGLIALALLAAEGVESALAGDFSGRFFKTAAVISFLFAALVSLVFILQNRHTGPENEWSILINSIIIGKTWAAWAFFAATAAMLIFRWRLGLNTERGMARAMAVLFLVEALAGGLTGMVRRYPWTPPVDPIPAPALPGGQYQPYRNLTFAPWDQWRSLDVSIQSGSEAGTRSIDGFISMPPLRYAEFLSLLSPEALQVKNGRIEHESLMSAFKREGFIDTNSLALLEFLNVGRIFSERINFKFTPVYSLLFEQPSRFVFAGSISAAPDGDSWHTSGAASFETTAASPAGAMFLATVKAKGPKETAFIVMAQGGIQYARALGPGEESSIKFPAGAGDLKLKGVSVALGNQSSGAQWIDPRLSVSDGPLRTIERKGDLLVARDPRALGPAFIVHKVRVIGDGTRRLAWIAENPESLRDTAVLEHDPPISPLPADTSREGVEIIGYESQRIDLKAMLMAPAVVVTSEAWYPGWRAWSRGGGEMELIRADHAFRALALPAGPGEVRMVYRPESFRIGLWLSLAVIAGLFTALLTARLKGRAASARSPR